MKRRGDDGRGAVHLAALGPVRTLRIQLGNETHMYVYIYIKTCINIVR